MRQQMPGMVGGQLFKTRVELRDYIITHGCYGAEANSTIYDKWFATAPRYLFRAVDATYHLTAQGLCDVGCSYGMNLLFCAPGSYGLEVEASEVKFAQSLKLPVIQRDVIEEDLSDLPKVAAVWNSAVLEHVVSPHMFLRKLHSLLNPDGLLALYVPTIPAVPWLRRLPKVGRYFMGYTASDHINAFTPATIRFFCERAGFRTVEVAPFYPGPLRCFNHAPLVSRLVDGCVYVGRKVEGWDYPEKATRRVAPNICGFVTVGQRLHQD